ncbi:unnamed protein product [Soboliphyme baturini]|uniref:DUF862 domain-containing protein n=1 Tax=Soboliphyme baturini TaxID=241478 RepID=A0A183ICL7_9BILA|nr:unnamed protein product [Soboliphyme baturini]
MPDNVILCIYDLSLGLARSLSASLLGTELRGIWHTSVVVYGGEYYYGDSGILCSPPYQTVLGRPTKTMEMGSTEIPQDLFEEYLITVSEEEFKPIGRMISPFIDHVMATANGERHIGAPSSDHQDFSQNSQANSNSTPSSAAGKQVGDTFLFLSEF